MIAQSDNFLFFPALIVAALAFPALVCTITGLVLTLGLLWTIAAVASTGLAFVRLLGVGLAGAAVGRRIFPGLLLAGFFVPNCIITRLVTPGRFG